MKQVAFIYDFDRTLAPRDMQEYGLIQDLGFDHVQDFWKIVGNNTQLNSCESNLSYMYELVEYAKNKGIYLNRERLASYGDKIEFFNGVLSWFKRINDYGLSKDLQIEHYIISSGLQEIIEHTPIANEFKVIYACKYLYDNHGNVIWPSNVINYTTKTQYLFRINKQILDINDNSINDYKPLQQRAIPFERMIYIADGYSDVPAFRLVKEYHGHSIAVYNDDDSVAKQLLKDGRINNYFKADYSDNSQLEKYCFNIIDLIHSKTVLQDSDRQKVETN